MTMEAEVGVMQLQAKECHGFLATPEAKRKARNLRESMTLLTL